jgi:hypothetical protein
MTTELPRNRKSSPGLASSTRSHSLPQFPHAAMTLIPALSSMAPYAFIDYILRAQRPPDLCRVTQCRGTKGPMLVGLLEEQRLHLSWVQGGNSGHCRSWRGPPPRYQGPTPGSPILFLPPGGLRSGLQVLLCLRVGFPLPGGFY